MSRSFSPPLSLHVRLFVIANPICMYVFFIFKVLSFFLYTKILRPFPVLMPYIHIYCKLFTVISDKFLLFFTLEKRQCGSMKAYAVQL